MDKRYHPITGTIIEPVEPVEPKMHFNAVTNLPEKGTKIHAVIPGIADVRGKVKYRTPEYGTLTIEHDIWIDNHFRGTAEFRISVRAGWEITIEDGE